MKYNLENCWENKNEIIHLINKKLNSGGYYIDKLKQVNNENQFQSILLSIFSLLVKHNIIDDYIPEGFEMNNDIVYSIIYMYDIHIPNNFKFPNKCCSIWLDNSTIGDNVVLPNKCNYIHITKDTKFGNNITFPNKCIGIKFWDNKNII